MHLKSPAALGALHPIWATPSGSDAPRIVVDPGEDRLCDPSGAARFDSAIERKTLAIGPIPNDSAAALILLEHDWAVPLRDAIARTGGFRISDGFISPLDLVEIGLLAEEDTEAHALPGEV